MIWLILLGVYILSMLACRILTIYLYESEERQDFDMYDFWFCIIPVINLIYALILSIAIIIIEVEQNIVDNQHNIDIIDKFFGKK